MKIYDVIIIGAGVIGNAIAAELSKYRVSVCVLEREYDVAFGISGRNSGVLHAGFNNKPGTKKAKYCLLGSQGFEEEAKRLGIEFKRTGKLVTALHNEDLDVLEHLLEQGIKNGVGGLEIIDESQIKKINPKIRGIKALYSAETGIFDPFEYVIALAEEASLNGTEYFFDSKVTGTESIPLADNLKNGAKGLKVTVERMGNTENFTGRAVINSAGLSAALLCAGADKEYADVRTYPCRGEYHILDRIISRDLEIPVYPAPNPKSGGLGVHFTPTIHGNLMIGPSAEYIDEAFDCSTTIKVMDNLSREGEELFPGINRGHIIRSFAGIRPKLTIKGQEEKDFEIIIHKNVPGMISLLGIESPGMTAAIPLARHVTDLLKKEKLISPTERDAVFTVRQRKFGQSSPSSERGSRRIICRCESQTEETILDAFDRIDAIGAIPTLKGLKNRTRTGMGNCQGSFCMVNIIELLEKKRGINPLEFCDATSFGRIFTGRVKG